MTTTVPSTGRAASLGGLGSVVAISSSDPSKSAAVDCGDQGEIVQHVCPEVNHRSPPQKNTQQLSSANNPSHQQ